MAARRGTSRDTLAWPLAAWLAACQSPTADPHRNLPGSSSDDPSTGSGSDPTTSSTTLPADTGSGTFDTGGNQRGDYPSPDCATVLLPGIPSDVAASPRPDHDAEVLALSVQPSRAAAPQARYDVVTADLAAIRALDPTLAEVHVGCVFPNGIAFWFFDDEDVNDALFAGDYHTWDCHNSYYDRRQELRIDGLAVAIELDGVFGEAVAEAYATLPGLDDQEPYWFPRDDWSVDVDPGSECTATAGSITLTATLSPDDSLDQRDYRFERTDGSSVVYRVTLTEPPQLLR